MEVEVDWSKLPPEVVEVISKKITILNDYNHFQAVCRDWQSSVPKNPNHLPTQLPWLMLSQQQAAKSQRAFFNVTTNKVHLLDLPEISHGERHCGSSHGWLVILSDNPKVLLINPLTHGKSELPPLYTFPHVINYNDSEIGKEYTLLSLVGDYSLSSREMRQSFIKKVVLSSSPVEDNDFVAVAILGLSGDLAYCRNGEQSWRLIEGAQSYAEDVIYSKGLIYAVNKAGAVAVCDVNGDLPKLSIIKTPLHFGADLQYLVCSGDDLLLVTRYFDPNFDFEPYQLYAMYKTMRFEVYRLNWDREHWERVSSLGDRMLFIGQNTSLCLAASDFLGCMGDCIYFTDEFTQGRYHGLPGKDDLGIFKLRDGSIEPLPSYPWLLKASGWPLAIWVTPNPCLSDSNVVMPAFKDLAKRNRKRKHD